MNTLVVSTNGRPVQATYSKLRRHPNLGVEMASLDLRIGNMEVCIRFESWDEMVQFCEKHNFSYEDEREEQPE